MDIFDKILHILPSDKIHAVLATQYYNYLKSAKII